MSNSTTYIETATGPFSVKYIGHFDAAAFDREAGKLGACVREADLSLAFRDTNDEFHRKFTPILEELTGVVRQIDKKKNEAKRKLVKDKVNMVPIYESFITFANRAKATVLLEPDGESKWEEIEKQALEFSMSIKIDAAPRERIGRINNRDLQKAEEWLASGNIEFIEGRIAKYIEYLGEYDLKRDASGLPIAESLALLITAFLKKRNEENLLED